MKVLIINFQKLTLVIDAYDIFHEIALWWMSPDLTDDKSTLVQVQVP